MELYQYHEANIDLATGAAWEFDPRLDYLAGEVMKRLGVVDTGEMMMALERAIQACNTMHIPFHRNFRSVFRFDGNDMVADWKISSLASYLIVINCDPRHEAVARAQMWFAMNR